MKTTVAARAARKAKVARRLDKITDLINVRGPMCAKGVSLAIEIDVRLAQQDLKQLVDAGKLKLSKKLARTFFWENVADSDKAE